MTIISHEQRVRLVWLAIIFMLIFGGILTFAFTGKPLPGLGTLLASEAHAEPTVPDLAIDPNKMLEESHDTTETAMTAMGEEDATQVIFDVNPLESLAESLRMRKLELDEREQKLNDEAQRLEQLRLETEQNLARSQQVLQQMQKLAGEADAKRQQELGKWIKIYEGMPPQEAANVMSGLDVDFALELFAQMDSKKAGKILAAFPPERAIEIGKLLNQPTS